MKYSINIKSGNSLEVCVGEYETFEKAKTQMTKFVVSLIASQRDDIFDEWENLKEDFPEEIQEILNSFEETGTANIDYETYDEYDDDTSYYAGEKMFSIVGKPNVVGFNLSIITDAVNMYDSDQEYYFSLCRTSDEGNETKLTIWLLVDDETVEVYNIVPDDVNSQLEPIDLEDE